MTEIETIRTQRMLTNDWQIEVVGLTNDEAMLVSAFVSQIIMARMATGVTGYDPMRDEAVASILTKPAQSPFDKAKTRQ